MIRKFPYKIPIITILYGIGMGLLCLGIFGLLFRIQTQYGSRLGINLRFNIYEGITVIDSAKYVWQYGAYALLITIMNGFLIWYVQKRFTNLSIQYIIVYWIFGSSIFAVSLLGIYLWLVIRINS